jgi:PAS domain S-box-containing protein
MQTNHLQFQRLLDKLPAGAYTCDSEGLITYFNEQAVQLWGREPKPNDPVDRYCGSFRLFAVDGSPLRHDQCWMALALQTGKGFNREEIIIERPDGSRINALAHANPIHDDLENVVGAVNVLVDISERRQAEDAKALLASIVESSDDAIVSKTLDGRILTWNKGAERLFGFTAKEAIGSSVTIIIPPDRLDEEKEILSRLRQGKKIDHYETVRVSKNGRQIDVSLSISPIRNSAGCIIGASKVARDITARKQGDADLQRLHEMSSLLASTLELPIIIDGTLRTCFENQFCRFASRFDMSPIIAM